MSVLSQRLKAAPSLMVMTVLVVACVAGIVSRLFSVLRYESMIHEFDPWFNYRSTKQMVEKGLNEFVNWFDDRAWYPLGRIVGGTVYPGLMFTSGSIHWFLHLLNIPVHIREICVFLAPLFSGLTAISAFLLTKELWNTGAGLLAASFICIAPGYTQRSVAGSYDNEGIAIFAMVFTYYLWIKAHKTGSVFWSALTALSYLYMAAAWGGYVFIINMIPIHVFTLMIIGRFSSRTYVAYCSFYVLALLLAMQVPFIGFQPVRTSEHMAAAGVFGLANLFKLFQLLRYLTTYVKLDRSAIINKTTLAVASVLLIVLEQIVERYKDCIAPWTGRFYSMWDTGYAKVHIPIIASVSEHQPPTWGNFLMNLHVMVCTFAAGAYFCIQFLTDELVFIVLYAVFASYFSGIMVRLTLTLTPVVCILSAIAFSTILETLLQGTNKPTVSSYKVRENHELTDTNKPTVDSDIIKEDHDLTKVIEENDDGEANKSSWFAKIVKVVVGVVLVASLLMYPFHCTWTTSTMFSSPGIVRVLYRNDGTRVIKDDYREAYYWLSQNTRPDARIMSWWDYGYQIGGIANRTTLVDNNTWNNTHIAIVGKAMASPEPEAYKIARQLDVDFVLIIFGGFSGIGSDDLNKFAWMVRIAQGEFPLAVQESKFNKYAVDGSASKTMTRSLMYRLSYYRFGQVQFNPRLPAGFDRLRNVEIGLKNYKLKYFEEAFTSADWVVRIFKVKNLTNKIHFASNRWRKPLLTSVVNRKSNRGMNGVLGVNLMKTIVKGHKVRRLQ